MDVRGAPARRRTLIRSGGFSDGSGWAFWYAADQRGRLLEMNRWHPSILAQVFVAAWFIHRSDGTTRLSAVPSKTRVSYG